MLFAFFLSVVAGEVLPALTLLVRAAPALCDAPMVAISVNVHDG